MHLYEIIAGCDDDLGIYVCLFLRCIESETFMCRHRYLCLNHMVEPAVEHHIQRNPLK